MCGIYCGPPTVAATAGRLILLVCSAGWGLPCTRICSRTVGMLKRRGVAKTRKTTNKKADTSIGGVITTGVVGVVVARLTIAAREVLAVRVARHQTSCTCVSMLESNVSAWPTEEQKSGAGGMTKAQVIIWLVSRTTNMRCCKSHCTYALFSGTCTSMMETQTMTIETYGKVF